MTQRRPRRPTLVAPTGSRDRRRRDSPSRRASRRRRGAVGLDTRVHRGRSALFGWAVGISTPLRQLVLLAPATGEWILDHGIPHHDVFSFTAPGTKWVAQSWLAELHVRDPRPVGRRVRHPVVRRSRRRGRSACSRTARRCGLARDRVVACGITLAALAWDLRALVGAAAPDRRALLPRAAVGRRGARLASSVAIRSIVMPVLFWLWANIHGELRARLRLPRRCTCSVAGSTAHRPWDGRERLLLDRQRSSGSSRRS